MVWLPFFIYTRITHELHTNYTRITHELHTKNEMEDKHIDWFIATICRGFARYDANEAYTDRDSSPRDGDIEGYDN